MTEQQTILTVDDQDYIRLVIKEVLTVAGYKVLEANNGQAALDVLAREEVDLILLDRDMPVMGGTEAASKIKGDARTREIPLVMLTARDKVEEKIEGLESGADEYLNKPINPNELIARVKALLRMHGLQKDIRRLEKQHFEEQMEMAREVQASVLPPKLPPVSGVEMAVHYQPCDEVGGDFYDLVGDEADRACLILGDTEGHGVGAALLMTRASAYVRATILDTGCSPGQILQQVNKLILQDYANASLLPMTCILFDPTNDCIRYANAGHIPPVLFQKKNESFYEFEPANAMLGTIEDEYFEEVKIPFLPGDCLACFTDGLTEAVDADSNHFDELDFRELLHADSTPEAIVEEIAKRWAEFTGPRIRDDMTLLVASRLGV